jgi:hypothetical protein
VNTPNLVSSSSNTGASGTSLIITAPASIAAGNLLWAFIAPTNTGTNIIAPAGWKPGYPTVPTGVFYKVATGTEPANYTFTWTNVSVSAGIILNVGTVPASGGIDVLGGPDSGTGLNINASASTARNYSDLLVCVYVCDAAVTITLPGSQSPTGALQGNTMSIIAGYETFTNSLGHIATTVASHNWWSASFYAMGTITAAVMLGFGSKAFGVGATGQFAGRAAAQPYGGSYKVQGHCRDINTLLPIQREVWIAPEGAPTLALLSTFSDPVTGYYVFNNLAAGRYIVYGFDTNQLQDSVAHAMVAAVPM